MDSLSLISTAQMGIPQDADTAKREVAKRILSEHKDFASIFFRTLEGDLYMGEPFEQQKQLPRLNYSDRDWYQGVSGTDNAYTSSVFMSAAINEPAIAVAVPVSAPDGGNKTVGTVGYWVVVVNLDTIESGLRDMQNDAWRVILSTTMGLKSQTRQETSQQRGQSCGALLTCTESGRHLQANRAP